MVARYWLEAYGCSASFADASMIAGQLEQAGYTRVDSPERADLNIIVTCTVKTPTAQRMRHRISRLTGVGKPLIVAGCMPKTELGAILAINPQVGLVGPQSIDRILEVADTLLKEGRPLWALEDSGRPKLELPTVRLNPVVEIVEIASGCLSACSFCQVKLAKGVLKSYPPEMVVRAVSRAVRAGCREVWLTSTDNGCYGFDLGTNLARLLREVATVDGDFWVRVGMLNPAHLRRYLGELVEAFRLERVFKFLHLPVQSGSDRVLRQMARGHTVEEFVEAVREFRSAIPGITISTDIIVGYPTEREVDFEATVQLLKEVEPDVVNLSRFSKRPGTRAAQLPQLPNTVVKERSGILHYLIQELTLHRNRRWIGWRGWALVDEVVEGAFAARNFAYKPVILKHPGLGLGQDVYVEIREATPNCLVGVVVDERPLEEVQLARP